MGSLMRVTTLITITVMMVIMFVSESEGSVCTRRVGLGSIDQFSCPGLFDSNKKAFCCGTEVNRYCCKWSKAKEHQFRMTNGNTAGTVMKGIGTALLVILLVGIGCVGLCCWCICSACARKRTRGVVTGGGMNGGGMDLGNSYAMPATNESIVGGQSVHVVNSTIPQFPTYPQQQPPSGSYGAPPPQVTYPPLYPMGVQAPPPPYPMGSAAPYPTGSNPPYPMATNEDKPLPYNPHYQPQ